MTHRPAEAAGSVPWVSGRSANIDVQAMAPTRSNSLDRTGDQTRCPKSDCGGLGLPLTGVGAWRRTPCDVSTSDGVSRLSAACGRAVGPSCARAAIGPAASVTNRAKDKGFMRAGEWKRLHREDCLPRPGGPQTGKSAALSLDPVLAGLGLMLLAALQDQPRVRKVATAGGRLVDPVVNRAGVSPHDVQVVV